MTQIRILPALTSHLIKMNSLWWWKKYILRMWGSKRCSQLRPGQLGLAEGMVEVGFGENKLWRSLDFAWESCEWCQKMLLNSQRTSWLQYPAQKKLVTLSFWAVGGGGASSFPRRIKNRDSQMVFPDSLYQCHLGTCKKYVFCAHPPLAYWLWQMMQLPVFKSQRQ